MQGGITVASGILKPQNCFESEVQLRRAKTSMMWRCWHAWHHQLATIIQCPQQHVQRLAGELNVVAHTVYPQRYGGVVSLENELSPQQLYVFYGHPFQVAHDGDGVGSGQSKQSSSPGHDAPQPRTSSNAECQDSMFAISSSAAAMFGAKSQALANSLPQ